MVEKSIIFGIKPVHLGFCANCPCKKDCIYGTFPERNTACFSRVTMLLWIRRRPPWSHCCMFYFSMQPMSVEIPISVLVDSAWSPKAVLAPMWVPLSDCWQALLLAGLRCVYIRRFLVGRNLYADLFLNWYGW